MKLLFALYKYFPWGGLQKDTLRFAEEAVRRGHQATILTTGWQGDCPPGIEVRRCECHGWSNHARMVHFAEEFRRIKETCEFQATLAMNRIPGADFYFVADSCMALWMPKKHSWLALHLLPRYRVYLRQEAEICAPDSPTRLMVIAPSQKREYQQAYGLPDERFVALPPGMDPRCGHPADASARRLAKRRELGLSDDELVCLEVGTNLWRKGVDRSMAAVVAQMTLGRKIRFLLVGGDGQDGVRSMAEQFGLCEIVQCLGPRDDVPDLLLAADVMVHPAREEGTGTVLIEAIAAGLPVICTAVCGFADYVAASGGRVVPEPFEQTALNEALADCLEHRAELSRRALDYAATQDFTGRSRAAIKTLEEGPASRSETA